MPTRVRIVFGAYEALAKKVQLAIRFYGRLDEGLDEAFFRSLSR